MYIFLLNDIRKKNTIKQMTQKIDSSKKKGIKTSYKLFT